MMMTSPIRKLALTLHVTVSVGWLGAVAGFLALSIIGLTSQDPQTIQAVYLAMELTAVYVIVPSSVAALLTGLVQALGTKWGLFQHYWVVIKLLITLVATVILLVHMQPIHYLADAARETVFSSTDLRQLRIQLMTDAGAALVALLVTTALSIYQPRGLTPYGWRKQQAQQTKSTSFATTTYRQNR
jgi:hypothetical protein